MKYIPFLFLIILLAACRKDSASPTEMIHSHLGEPFDLKIGESVSIKNEQLNFQFVNVPEDSRCPLGAMCIWAGNASVVLKIFDVMDTVNTFLNPKGVQYHPYTITLIQLSPYPTIGVPRDTAQYVGQFIVTKN
jgi:hypothetical protein